MEYTWLFWFLLAIVFAIIELTNASFFIIWFGVGSLAAMVVSFFVSSLPIQFLVFIIVSSILLVRTRKFTAKVTDSNITHTNVDAVIGKIGIVTEDIPALDNPGIVQIAGEIWSAISADSKPIKKGQKVEVLQVRGVRLVVQTLNSEKE